MNELSGIDTINGLPYPPAAPSAPVDSVFTRVGAVLAAASDYDGSQIDNDSGVPGTFVSDALDTLAGLIPPAAPVASVFTRVGAVVAAASDYDASQVDNDSVVVGATVADALNTLNAVSGGTSFIGFLADANLNMNGMSRFHETPIIQLDGSSRTLNTTTDVGNLFMIDANLSLVYTMPAISIGLNYRFLFNGGGGRLTLQVPGGAVIAIGQSQSASGGTMYTETVGACIELVCVNSFMWRAVTSNLPNNWTVGVL